MCTRNLERENKEDCVREEDRSKVQRWKGGVVKRKKMLAIMFVVVTSVV